MNTFLQQRISAMAGMPMAPQAPMMMAEGGGVDANYLDLQDPQVQSDIAMSAEMPMDPNAGLRQTIAELMNTAATAEDPMDAKVAMGFAKAAEVGTQAPMADMAVQLSQAGRGPDTTLAHLAPGEVVLPPQLMTDPEFEKIVGDRFAELDMNPEEYVVGAGIASLNPVTGLEEFGWIKKTLKSAKKVIKNVVKPVAQVAQFIPGPWQVPAALIAKGYAAYDAVKGGNPLAAIASLAAPLPGAGSAAGKGISSLLGGTKEFLTAGADGVGFFGNVGKGISSLGTNLKGTIIGGGADGAGNFGTLGDAFGNLGTNLKGTIIGGGADGVGNFGTLGDTLGGFGDAIGVTDYASMSNPGAVLGQLSVTNPEINDIVDAGVRAGKSMDTILAEVQQMGIGGSGGKFMNVANTLMGMGGGTVDLGSEQSNAIIEAYLAQFPEQRGGINAMLGSGITVDELAAQLMGIPEFQSAQAGSQQQGGSFFGVKTPDSIKAIGDAIGLGGASGLSDFYGAGAQSQAGGGSGGSGMFGGMGVGGVLGTAGLAGILAKLAYDEAKNRKGVPLTPLTQMNAAGRYNIEAEIARRMGQPAPNPVEFGLLPNNFPTLSGGQPIPEGQQFTPRQILLEPNPNDINEAMPLPNYTPPTGMLPQLQQIPAYNQGGAVYRSEGGDMDGELFIRMTGDINGEGTEISDDIPAMLSDGEFVMTGRAVRGAGSFDMNNSDGIITLTPMAGENKEKGIDMMYKMMDLFSEFARPPQAKGA